MADAAAEALKRHWGFSAFRPAQRGVIDAILAGRDALVIMATGSGKSVWCARAARAAAAVLRNADGRQGAACETPRGAACVRG